MAKQTTRLTEVFLDSGHAIAVSAATDGLHERAVALAEQLPQAHTKTVTTRTE